MANNFGNSINSIIGASNSGATNILTVTNPSNTASSQAQELITVGGATAGDPFTTYTITGAQSYSMGIDNSDSDFFKISASTALGTTDFFTYNPATVLTLTLSQLFEIIAAPGAGVFVSVQNTSDTSGSEADVQISVGGTSALDPFTQYNIGTSSPTTSWATGISNANSDVYRLVSNTGAGAKPGTGSVVMAAQVTGEINYPLQPAFLATKTVAQDNATGAGTLVTVNFTNEVFDQNGDYDGTNTFTAPVTGRYFLSTCVYLSGITAAMTAGFVQLVTSNRTYFGEVKGPFLSAQAGADTTWMANTLSDMDAADTSVVKLQINNGAGDTADLAVVATGTYYSGNLVC